MAVQRRLLSETDLDFAKAFQIALAMESATANAAQLCSTGHERSQEGAEVNKILAYTTVSIYNLSLVQLTFIVLQLNRSVRSFVTLALLHKLFNSITLCHN